MGAADSALDIGCWGEIAHFYIVSDERLFRAIRLYLRRKKNLKQKYQSSWHIAHDSTRHGLGIFAHPNDARAARALANWALMTFQLQTQTWTESRSVNFLTELLVLIGGTAVSL